jgi:CRP/FNR family transcriptional regulator, cyclic AMP receptor protein
LGLARLDRQGPRHEGTRLDTSFFFQYPDGTADATADRSVFLPDWTDEDWARLLAYTETRRFRGGEDIIQAGEADRALYIIGTGAVDVVLPSHGRQRERVLARIEAGSIIGEVSFLDGGPRSANVRGVAEGDVVRLSYEAFRVFAAREPDLAQAFLFDLCRIVASRLRRSNDILARG